MMLCGLINKSRQLSLFGFFFPVFVFYLEQDGSLFCQISPVFWLTQHRGRHEPENRNNESFYPLSKETLIMCKYAHLHNQRDFLFFYFFIFFISQSGNSLRGYKNFWVNIDSKAEKKQENKLWWGKKWQGNVTFTIISRRKKWILTQSFNVAK